MYFHLDSVSFPFSVLIMEMPASSYIYEQLNKAMETFHVVIGKHHRQLGSERRCNRQMKILCQDQMAIIFFFEGGWFLFVCLFVCFGPLCLLYFCTTGPRIYSVCLL